jgi:hypothetical protein
MPQTASVAFARKNLEFSADPQPRVTFPGKIREKDDVKVLWARIHCFAIGLNIICHKFFALRS